MSEKCLVPNTGLFEAFLVTRRQKEQTTGRDAHVVADNRDWVHVELEIGHYFNANDVEHSIGTCWTDISSASSDSQELCVNYIAS
jgi:hypothetical protein